MFERQRRLFLKPINGSITTSPTLEPILIILSSKVSGFSVGVFGDMPLGFNFPKISHLLAAVYFFGNIIIESVFFVFCRNPD